MNKSNFVEIVNNLKINKLENIYKENFSQVHGELMSLESLFLTGIYDRYYKDLDCANIVLYFAKYLHKEIIKEKLNDLDYNISFDNFWDNHNKFKQLKFSIISISRETGLPKETTRRKMHQLIKTKTLKKIDNKIIWEPMDTHKLSYNSLIEKEINEIIRFLNIMNKCTGIKLDSIKFKEAFRLNFSFIWYHFLDSQLKLLKIWQAKFKDLELLLINLECSIQGNRIYDKECSKYENHFFYTNSINFKEEIPSVSATSICDVTGIPRATCIRKLDKLTDMKLISKDKITKRYSVNLNQKSNHGIERKKIIDEVITVFSQLYLTILRTVVKG